MPSIRHFIIINTSADKIYKALTTNEGIHGWWTVETEIGREKGDTNVFKFGERYYNEMKITGLVQDKRVEWQCYIGDKEWIGTNIIFDLEEKNKETVLRFIHNNWKEETDFFTSCNYQGRII